MRNILKTASFTLSVTALMAISTVSHAKGDRFSKADVNGDGKLTVAEYVAKLKKPEKGAKRFARFDTNKDGFVSKKEFVTGSNKKKSKKKK
jgi:Ca2+-binding EF-hand superfamily protein